MNFPQSIYISSECFYFPVFTAEASGQLVMTEKSEEKTHFAIKKCLASFEGILYFIFYFIKFA